jgi:hypothetical protein
LAAAESAALPAAVNFLLALLTGLAVFALIAAHLALAAAAMALRPAAVIFRFFGLFDASGAAVSAGQPRS